MPLLDHFHSPLYPLHAWESFHSGWANELRRHLNRKVLPRSYFAEATAHVGGHVEVDVATLEENGPQGPGGTGSNGGVAIETWAPPTTALSMPSVFPDEFEVQVFSTVGGRTLVAAVEIVSPGNKDRPEARRAFATKCASYLQAGVGLVIVDVVTSYRDNLHDELIRLLEQAENYLFPGTPPLYTSAYRPRRRKIGDDQIELWLTPLAVGQALPIMPLALRNGPTLPLDLETTYTEMREGSRL